MNVTLRALTLGECQLVREWRNDSAVLPMLRTGAKTQAEQDAFYHNIVINPAADHRYYAIDADGEFVGMGGLTYLSRVPGEAEISLILGPAARGRGIGSAAVDALLQQSRTLGLKAVIGECYGAGATGFWLKQLRRYEPESSELLEGDTLRWRWA